MASPGRRTALSFVMTLGVLVGCQQGFAAEATETRPVRSITVRTEQSSLPSFPGIVEARVETDLAFRVLGHVISRRAEVADLVSKTDILAEIDPALLRLAVTSAEADLRNAQAQLANATVTEKRKRALASSNTGSVADLDLAELGLKSAQASVAKAQASLAKAQEQLGYTKLRAEFDGVVTSTSVDVGQIVTAGQAVLKLARLGQRDVVIDVPEEQAGSLQLGAKFSVFVQLDSRIRTSGVLREIGPEADASTRTHRLKIAIDDAPEVFRLGSTVTATAIGADLPQGAIVVPATAILQKGGATLVWVIDPATRTIATRPVDLATVTPGAPDVRVLSGLRDGEEIAVAGVHELGEGQKVRLEKELRP